MKLILFTLISVSSLVFFKRTSIATITSATSSFYQEFLFYQLNGPPVVCNLTDQHHHINMQMIKSNNGLFPFCKTDFLGGPFNCQKCWYRRRNELKNIDCDNMVVICKKLVFLMRNDTREITETLITCVIQT